MWPGRRGFGIIFSFKYCTMKIIQKTSELEAVLAEERSAGKKIGLVPTMGALHAEIGRASCRERV